MRNVTVFPIFTSVFIMIFSWICQACKQKTTWIGDSKYFSRTKVVKTFKMFELKQELFCFNWQTTKCHLPVSWIIVILRRNFDAFASHLLCTAPRLPVFPSDFHQFRGIFDFFQILLLQISLAIEILLVRDLFSAN